MNRTNRTVARGGMWVVVVAMMGIISMALSVDDPIAGKTTTPTDAFAKTNTAESVKAREAASRLERVSNDYLEAFWSFNPIRAATAGLHAYDGRLPDRSHDTVKAWVAFNRATTRLLSSVDFNQLNADELVDYRVLQFQIGEELFQWEVLEAHRTNPMTYDIGWSLQIIIRVRR